MTKVASELRAAINRLKTPRTNAAETATGERLKNNGIDFPATALGNQILYIDELVFPCLTFFSWILTSQVERLKSFTNFWPS